MKKPKTLAEHKASFGGKMAFGYKDIDDTWNEALQAAADATRALCFMETEVPEGERRTNPAFIAWKIEQMKVEA